MAAAWAALLRWGWRPREFLALERRERAFVIAGLALEREYRQRADAPQNRMERKRKT
ncbi:MAG: hypothetical protein IJB55_06075 [Firmicutes bacterium]|nr:hypothetical protein [Bacillota bacterium]